MSTKKLTSEKIFSSEDMQIEASGIGGISEKTLGTVENEKVLIKGNGGDHQESLAEYFAYKLGSALGLNINKVNIIDCGDLFGLSKIASVHWWENKLLLYRDGRDLTGPERTLLEFFDALIENEDRNSGNYGFVNNELFLIDHGFSNPWWEFDEFSYSTRDSIRKAVESPYCLPYVEKFMALTPKDFENMLELPEDFQHTLTKRIEMILERMFKLQLFIYKHQQECGY